MKRWDPLWFALERSASPTSWLAPAHLNVRHVQNENIKTQSENSLVAEVRDTSNRVRYIRAPSQKKLHKSDLDPNALVDKIVKALNIKELDWILSYQSRVGPLKWIGPSTENIIVENSKLGKHIVLVPIAFVSEHSETLVELDIEYKELADKNGCKNYSRVPALGTNENYIKAMSNLIINKHDYNFNGELFPPKLQCPNQFKKCPCLSYE